MHKRKISITLGRMFKLCKFRQIIRIPPHRFGEDVVKYLERKIGEMFINKVILNYGLGVCVHSIEEIGDSITLPGDGGAHTEVTWNMIVFHPNIGEVLKGEISKCDSTGVSDIFIPREYLPQPSKFLQNEQIWSWQYEVDDGFAELFLEPGSKVRFRVIDEVFKDIPTQVSDDSQENTNQKCYEIYGAMNDTGLGCISWWNAS
ncbi:DNA-directed RNA polymerase III subunit polypeptide [Trichinella spiralis]|uniref:DNA-directed RNA polymerase III subunit polypeptide n=1 Tax=Trichinella spiralis TaxID=6334 RepID=UPI0001EFBE14|nr:DNA-directed RNA polymerase III subunit polypeptide [Trichinella spiralis]